MKSSCFWASVALLWVAAAGCDDDDDSAGRYTVSGTVTSDVAFDAANGGDGKGTIYLFLQKECLTTAGTTTDLAGSAVIQGADLSTAGAQVPFEITGVPDGSYKLTGFMDDAPNQVAVDDPSVPETGDLVFFTEVAPKCIDVVVSGGDVTGADIAFNWVMPFALPVGMSDDAGVDTSDGDVPVDDGHTYAISGTVTRVANPQFAQFHDDYAGPLYITLSTKCFDPEGGTLRDGLVDYVVIQGADLSQPTASIDFTFKAVKNGIYFVNGFIDDVTNATEDKPYPGKGDLVSFGGFGPRCTKVRVDGADVADVEFKCNMVMSFDLPGNLF